MAIQDWKAELAKEVHGADIKLHITYSNNSKGLNYEEFLAPSETTTDEWLQKYVADRIKNFETKAQAVTELTAGEITPATIDDEIPEPSAKDVYLALLFKYNQTRKAHTLGVIEDDGSALLDQLKADYKDEYLELFNGLFI